LKNAKVQDFPEGATVCALFGKDEVVAVTRGRSGKGSSQVTVRHYYADGKPLKSTAVCPLGAKLQDKSCTGTFHPLHPAYAHGVGSRSLQGARRKRVSSPRKNFHRHALFGPGLDDKPPAGDSPASITAQEQAQSTTATPEQAQSTTATPEQLRAIMEARATADAREQATSDAQDWADYTDFVTSDMQANPHKYTAPAMQAIMAARAGDRTGWNAMFHEEAFKRTGQDFGSAYESFIAHAANSLDESRRERRGRTSEGEGEGGGERQERHDEARGEWL
jgi:hypothetical protein